MSNDQKRPALARRVTRATEAERKEALEAGIKITLDGQSYELRMGDITSEIAREMRRATGMGFRALMSELPRDPDIDLISAFVWAARRVAGGVGKALALPPQKSSEPDARFSNLVSGFRNASFTVPVGPLRCLLMITSDTPGSLESLL